MGKKGESQKLVEFNCKVVGKDEKTRILMLSKQRKLNVLLVGANGKMGREVIKAAAEEKSGIEIVAGYDTAENEIDGVPVYNYQEGVNNRQYDAVLDFSKPESLAQVLYGLELNNPPLVMGTTGHSFEQMQQIEQVAQKRAVFKATNFSMGVFKWVRAAAALAAAFKNNPEVDIEIIEAHHNRKADGPSGTAKTVAEAILKARGWGQIVSRTPDNAKRLPGDIGISFIRCGDVPGYHEVWFASPSGEIRLSEREYGRQGFACGALDACKFMQGKPADRIYTMDDLV